MARLQTFLTRARTYWADLPDQRRWSLAAVVGVSLALMVLVGSILLRTPMSPLDFQPEDAADKAELRNSLIAMGVKVEVQPGTNLLMVPTARRADLEVEFGLVSTSSKPVGLELMDDQPFGGTQFREHTVYARGLAGEIEKMLNRYRSVASSKVMLSMQQDALFEEDQVAPSASVLLELKNGADLSVAEGERMARQVAGAVVGLRPERVQILDAHMRLLHGSVDSSEERAGSGLASLQREWERYYQLKVESLLGEMLGYGRASVRVSVELDHAERSNFERDLDPEKLVTIASKATERSTEGAADASGEPGTGANLRGGADSKKGAVSTMSTESVNVDVPETKKTDVTAPGRILAISAAVAVLGQHLVLPAVAGVEGAEETAPTGPVYTPRTEEELASLTLLVRNALGPEAKEVSVQNHQFDRPEMGPAKASLLAQLDPATASTVARYSLAILAFLFMYGFVLRPVIKTITELEEEADPEDIENALHDDPAGLLGAAEQPEFDVQDWLDRFSTGEQFVSRVDVSHLVLADIAHSVVTLHEWLAEEQEA